MGQTKEERRLSQNSWSANQRNIRQEFANKYKKDGCIKCGELDPVCLEFHHVDPTEKATEVSRLINNKASFDAIQQEIEKCVILCSNCHAKYHAGRFTIPLSSNR